LCESKFHFFCCVFRVLGDIMAQKYILSVCKMLSLILIFGNILQ